LPALSESQQLDFIEMIDTPDLPQNDAHTVEGDSFIVLRNIDTRFGLAKGKRSPAVQIKKWPVVCQFDSDGTRTVTRIRVMLVEAGHMTPSGIQCTRCLV
jgi:hypothetical protein